MLSDGESVTRACRSKKIWRPPTKNSDRSIKCYLYFHSKRYLSPTRLTHFLPRPSPPHSLPLSLHNDIHANSLPCSLPFLPLSPSHDIPLVSSHQSPASTTSQAEVIVKELCQPLHTVRKLANEFVAQESFRFEIEMSSTKVFFNVLILKFSILIVTCNHLRGPSHAYTDTSCAHAVHLRLRSTLRPYRDP